MRQVWEPLGLLLAPPSDLEWMKTHAALPCGDGSRIYFSGRDAEGRARIGYADVDLSSRRVKRVSARSVLELGDLGSFDDAGQTVSCIVSHGGRLWLYYSGWSLGVSVPFYFYVGLAVSDDGGETFRHVSRAPVMDRSATEPFLTASPAVRIEDGRWRAWYVSCSAWERTAAGPRHRYQVCHAESADGVTWTRDGRVAIPFAAAEHAHGRPCVLRDGDRYKMWFCARGETYRLAYAESADGFAWVRSDASIVFTAAHGAWAAESQCYPWVVDAGGERWMLYNGDGYGKTGIGLARLCASEG